MLQTFVRTVSVEFYFETKNVNRRIYSTWGLFTNNFIDSRLSRTMKLYKHEIFTNPRGLNPTNLSRVGLPFFSVYERESTKLTTPRLLSLKFGAGVKWNKLKWESPTVLWIRCKIFELSFGSWRFEWFVSHSVFSSVDKFIT